MTPEEFQSLQRGDIVYVQWNVYIKTQVITKDSAGNVYLQNLDDVRAAPLTFNSGEFLKLPAELTVEETGVKASASATLKQPLLAPSTGKNVSVLPIVTLTGPRAKVHPVNVAKILAKIEAEKKKDKVNVKVKVQEEKAVPAGPVGVSGAKEVIAASGPKGASGPVKVSSPKGVPAGILGTKVEKPAPSAAVKKEEKAAVKTPVKPTTQPLLAPPMKGGKPPIAKGNVKVQEAKKTTK